MRTVFADTFYFIALLCPGDEHHARVLEFAHSFDGSVVTTNWILAEVADALCASRMRRQVAAFLETAPSLPNFKTEPFGADLYHRGLNLYGDRPDKEWSLTDCISFAVMSEQHIVEALTRDRHFKQAGFVALFADPP